MKCCLSFLLLIGFVSRASGSPPPRPSQTRPTELVTVVRSPEAPLLNELEDDEAAAEIAHTGELLEVVRPLPPMKTKWRARMGDRLGEREGPMAEVRWASGDAIMYAFLVDLGTEIRVAATSWICEQIGRDVSLPEAARRTRCPKLLRRVRLPSGAIVGFEPCATGPCPVVLVRDGKVTALAVDGVVSAAVVPGGDDGVLLLTTRWVRATGNWSGGALVPIAFSAGGMKRLSDIPIDEIDARDAAKVTSREVKVEITSQDGGRSLVHVSGRRREVARVDGREISTAPIDERRSIP